MSQHLAKTLDCSPVHHMMMEATPTMMSLDEETIDNTDDMTDDYFLLVEDDDLDQLFAVRNHEKVSPSAAEALSRFYHKVSKRTKQTRHARRKDAWQ
jgi:hypothetical protein